MKFRDIIKYIRNYNFKLRIIKGNVEYLLTFDWDLDTLDKYFDLQLYSIVVFEGVLLISLIDE